MHKWKIFLWMQVAFPVHCPVYLVFWETICYAVLWCMITFLTLKEAYASVMTHVWKRYSDRINTNRLTVEVSRCLYDGLLERRCIFTMCLVVLANSKIANLESPFHRHAHQSLLLQRLVSGHSCGKDETHRKMFLF